MPILPRETDIYPDDLLEQQLGRAGDECIWWALYTLSRREKDLMRRLATLEIPFYAPLIARRTRSPAGRTRTSYVPLFPGYVFLRGSEDQRYEALTTNCVSRTLRVPNAEILEHDLRQIQRLIQSDAPLTPEARLAPGAKVRLRGGPLQGMEGVVIQRRGKQRLLVDVEFLQQGASISLEDYLVESID